MANTELSQKEQDRIVDEFISSLEEMGPEDDFDDSIYDQLDEWHISKLRTAIREFADAAVGDEHWDSDE